MNPLESSTSHEEVPENIDILHQEIEDSLGKGLEALIPQMSPEEAKEVFKASLIINRVFDNVLRDARPDGTSISDLPTVQGIIDDYIAKLGFDPSVLSGSVEKYHKLAVELAKEMPSMY